MMNPFNSETIPCAKGPDRFHSHDDPTSSIVEGHICESWFNL